MLIFEGPDGGGKTTLIKMFQKAIPDIEVAPRVVSKDTNALVDLQDWVEQNLSQGFQYKIFDRHRLISEPIYGPLLRSRPEPGFSDVWWLRERLRQFYELKPVIIYCLPPEEVVHRNIINDPDNSAVALRIHGIYSAYVARAAMDGILSPGITRVWDYTKYTPGINPPWFYSIYRYMKDRLK